MEHFNCILLIDDDESTNRFHEIIIHQLQLAKNIVKAKNGKEALTMLTNVDKPLLPELIFLDLNMPVMDGFRFLEKYQETSAYTNLKPTIVILTTSVIPEEKSKALFNNNIYRFLNKPMGKKEFLHLVEEIKTNQP